MTPKGRVSPFGHLRINGCSHLPEAFRRVPRPSSPLDAKASTRCPSTLARNSVMHRCPDPSCSGIPPFAGRTWCPGECARRPLLEIRYADDALPTRVHWVGAPPRLGRNVFTMIKSQPDGLPSGITFGRAATSYRAGRSRSGSFGERGGADRVRTGDLLLAKQALSQLSYSPAR